MISHKHKIIFIHIPKCAGTSIENALGHYEKHTANRGGQDHRSIRMIEQPWLTPYAFSNSDNAKELVRRFKYPRSTIYNENNRLTVSRAQYRDYYKFTVVRNPWVRVFSWYRNVVKDPIHLKKHNLSEDISFSDFLHRFIGKGMLAPQTYWLENFRGQIPMDFVGRFETLTTDFAKVCEEIGLQDFELPHKVKGSTSDYRQHFDSKLQQLVASHYQKEIDLFGYSFGD